MIKRKLIPLVLLFLVIIAFMILPVAAAGRNVSAIHGSPAPLQGAVTGLTITDGNKITASNGVSSAVITVSGADIPDGGTITINVSRLHAYVAKGQLTNANAIVNDNAANATWTRNVTGGFGNTFLNLTSTGGPTVAGENITLILTGAVNPWVNDSGGNPTLPLTVTRTDTGEAATIHFMIETISNPKVTAVTAVSAGLTITDGNKITSSNGVTSPVITISGADIPDGGTITINVSSLHPYVASTAFTESNIEVWSDSIDVGWWGVMDSDGINLTLMSAGGNTTSGESIFVNFTGAYNPWVTNSGGNKTLPLTVTRTDTGENATIHFMIETVSGLEVTNGETIGSPSGATSPVITVAGSDIPEGSTIAINLFYARGLLASWTLTDANIAISSNATAATWTPAVSGDTLMLTSTGGPTLAGETITVTFTGTAGNPWAVNTGGGPMTYPLTVTRSDGYDPVSFSISIDMIPPVSDGLNIANGDPITTTQGATSPVITITNQPIAQDDNITIFVPFLFSIIASYHLNDANVEINDTAANATWTRTVTGDRVILTSTGGPTAVDETVNVTFTGAANPWVVSLPVGQEYSYTTAVRGDGLGAGYFTFPISTQDPTDLIIADGAKINATDGATSPAITFTGADIVSNGTISIDLTALNTYVASGNITNANVMVNDTAVNATWTRNVTNSDGNSFLTLKSTGGPTVADENITLTFTGAVNPWTANTNGEKTESIFVYRDDGAGSGFLNFVIETTPPPEWMVAANFSASPTSEMAPLTVQFNDSSRGSPMSWSWDFGDGGTSIEQNPIHEYILPGYYTVALTATNAYGSDTKTRWDYIHVLNGEVMEANTTIDGLTVTNCGSPQTITVDTSILPATLIPNNSVLEIQPPADRGLKNITIYALDGIGFSQSGSLISGNPTGVHLVTEDLAPSQGFSAGIGTNASINISMDLSSYPCNAILSTKIWDGIITEYNSKLWQVASNNSAVPAGTAYTARFTKTNFPDGTNVKVYMSVNSIWKTLGENVFIWRIADDGNSGQILPTTYLYTDPVNNLDYYEADSPLGMSTFGISPFDGPNNPFQIVAFVAAAVVSPPGNPGPAAMGGTGGGTGGGGTSVAVQTAVAQGATPDPGKTTKIYTNAEGTITQATMLPSTDGLANIFLGLGIVARNSSGMPLPSISIRRIPAEELPTAPSGENLSFAGMAYELQPDGATFSPSIALSFTIPQEQGGKEYVIQENDDATGTWQALPGSFNPETGIITVQISHLCRFALFAQATETNVPENKPVKIAALTKPAMSTNLGMVGWGLSTIRENPWIIVIIAGVIALVAYFGWWKKRL